MLLLLVVPDCYQENKMRDSFLGLGLMKELELFFFPAIKQCFFLVYGSPWIL
jgi:hypothetical protein